VNAVKTNTGKGFKKAPGNHGSDKIPEKTRNPLRQ
jgi:hypothetical protein